MHKVEHGDCLETLTRLAEKGSAVDVVITDPPYSKKVHDCGRRGITDYVEPNRGSKRAQFNRTRELGFDYLRTDLRRDVSRLIARVTKRWALIFSDVEGVEAWRRDIESAGLQYVRTCFWRKRGATPQFTGDRPASHVEAIVAFHQTHDNGKPKKKRWNGGGRGNVFEHPIVLNRGGKVRVHTAQKPLALMRELVELFSDPGELICDPFAGSGSTLVAAKLLGRDALGIESDEEHVAKARERLRKTRAPKDSPVTKPTTKQGNDNAETTD